MHVKKETCSACGGKCCQRAPGLYHPADFGLPGSASERNVLETLAEGNTAIDWWEGDPRGTDREDPDFHPRGYFLRPATAKQHGHLRDPSWGGQCVHWTQQRGCALTPVERPAQCRRLIPSPDENCTYDDEAAMEKQALALAWLPYYALLDELHGLADVRRRLALVSRTEQRAARHEAQTASA